MVIQHDAGNRLHDFFAKWGRGVVIEIDAHGQTHRGGPATLPAGLRRVKRDAFISR